MAGSGEGGRALHICWAGKSAWSTGGYSILFRSAGGHSGSHRVAKSDNHLGSAADSVKLPLKKVVVDQPRTQTVVSFSAVNGGICHLWVL